MTANDMECPTVSTAGSTRILGISFYTGGSAIIDRLAEGGLVQVPSGPGLAEDLPSKPAYRRALLEADYVIPDSGLMVLIWNWLNRSGGARLERYSGLRLLRELLPRPEVRAKGATFWVMPTQADLNRNLAWLREQGHSDLTEEDCYVAPFYRSNLGPGGEVEDADLLARVEARKPRYVFVNVGSGVQEQLGWYLRRNLSYKPAILCTGAAISFLTGGQADIPPWADRLYLGWLLRVLRNPRQFGRRYLSAFKLIPRMLKEEA